LFQKFIDVLLTVLSDIVYREVLTCIVFRWRKGVRPSICSKSDCSSCNRRNKRRK